MAHGFGSAKFHDPKVTAKGEERASVGLHALETLWFNTGTLCNVTCGHCYIESSPKNDRLAFLSLADVTAYLDEIERDRLGTRPHHDGHRHRNDSCHGYRDNNLNSHANRDWNGDRDSHGNTDSGRRRDSTFGQCAH